MRLRARDIALGGTVAAIYVILTLFVAPLSFFVVQFRLSETLNVLPIFNRRYILALTVGVFLANFLANAVGFGLGPLDWFWGALQTFIMTSLGYLLSKRFKKLWQKLAIMVLVSSFMMWMIALELTIWYPQFIDDISFTGFLVTWLYLAISEAIMVSIGAIIAYYTNKKLDLSK